MLSRMWSEISEKLEKNTFFKNIVFNINMTDTLKVFLNNLILIF